VEDVEEIVKEFKDFLDGYRPRTSPREPALAPDGLEPSRKLTLPACSFSLIAAASRLATCRNELVDLAQALVGERAPVGAAEVGDDPVFLRGVVEAKTVSVLVVLQALDQLDALVESLKDLHVVVGDLFPILFYDGIVAGVRHMASLSFCWEMRRLPEPA